MNKDIVLIVGGAGGIGSEIAVNLSKKVETVIIADMDNSNIQKIKERGKGNIYYLHVDVTDLDSILRLEKDLESQYGRITHLISMAGGALKSEFQDIESVTYKDISDSIDLNLKGHIYILKAMKELLFNDKSKNKTTTLISSINAVKDFGLVSYSASKSGLYGVMNSTLNYFGDRGVRVNTISPGTVPTARTEGENKNFDSLIKGCISDSFTTPTDIADTVNSLMYEMKSVYGQNIIVDSGQSMKSSYYSDNDN